MVRTVISLEEKDFDPTRDELVVVPYTLSGSG